MKDLPFSEQSRATRAAEHVLVDLGQVLASYMDRMVLVGGLSPGLLFMEADPSHSGSIDVDIALKAEALEGGDYARLLEALIETGRYRLSTDPNRRFRLTTTVPLNDGLPEVVVPVDFLASPTAKFHKDDDSRFTDFRILQADGCETAFNDPVTCSLVDRPNAAGALNTVIWRVVAVENLLVMKSYALAGREKAKDAYDIVFCLNQLRQIGELRQTSEKWSKRKDEKDVQTARNILAEKFKSLNHIGPQWYADYLHAGDRDFNTRMAFELVKEFLRQESE